MAFDRLQGNLRAQRSRVCPSNGKDVDESAGFRRIHQLCRNVGVFETGFHMISMPYPNRNCETESLLMRLAEKHAEVFETKLQPYGSRHFECFSWAGGSLNMG